MSYSYDYTSCGLKAPAGWHLTEKCLRNETRFSRLPLNPTLKTFVFFLQERPPDCSWRPGPFDTSLAWQAQEGWFLRFYIGGPDGRYNGDLVDLTAANVLTLTKELQTAHRLGARIQSRVDAGDKLPDGSVAVTSDWSVNSREGRVSLSWKTGRWSRTLCLEDAVVLLNALEDMPSRAIATIEGLRLLDPDSQPESI